ncbi:LacI family DNA-binding transcriptional regulator [Streptomyces sp. M10(2022)]
MTVSRVLKGNEGVGEATRRRVLEAVTDLSYRRNETARNLRLGRHSGLVGLVVTNLANPFYAQLALGAEGGAGLRPAAGARQYRRTTRTGEGPCPGPRLPAGERSDRRPGRLRPTSPVARDAGRHPLVLASRPPAGIEADTVLVDDFGGARAATTRLVEDGHERVGFLGNPPTLFTGAERFRGWWSALEESGLRPREEWVRRGPYDVVTAEAAARELLDRAGAPTALFCANNRLTLGACRAVRGLGTAAALAGFDDVESADLLGVPSPWPPTTPPRSAAARPAAHAPLGGRIRDTADGPAAQDGHPDPAGHLRPVRPHGNRT